MNLPIGVITLPNTKNDVLYNLEGIAQYFMDEVYNPKIYFTFGNIDGAYMYRIMFDVIVSERVKYVGQISMAHPASISPRSAEFICAFVDTCIQANENVYARKLIHKIAKRRTNE